MAKITVTNQLSALRAVFNKMDEVYYSKTPLTVSKLASAITVDMELPVLSDGVTFNTGEPETIETKLTTGTNWVTRTEKGDSDISLQVASLKGIINDLFMDKKEEIVPTSNLAEDESYSGAAYSMAPKKISGALIMMSDSKDVIVILPSIEMYGSLVVADGDNPAYFNVIVTPLENEDGSDIFILEKQAA